MHKTYHIIMDQVLGSIINDYSLYKIIEAMIILLSMVIIYLGIQIALTWKFIQKERVKSDPIPLQQDSFFRSSLYIFIAGLFMVIHELFEGLEEDVPDFVTYEMFELIALSGFALFCYEWYKILNKMKKKN